LSQAYATGASDAARAAIVAVALFPCQGTHVAPLTLAIPMIIIVLSCFIYVHMWLVSVVFSCTDSETVCVV
jgi:hypothetical protein